MNLAERVDGETLSRLRQAGNTVDVLVGIFLTDDEPTGAAVSLRTIRALGERGLTLDIAIYPDIKE
jgi:hypothetical protein